MEISIILFVYNIRSGAYTVAQYPPIQPKEPVLLGFFYNIRSRAYIAQYFSIALRTCAACILIYYIILEAEPI